MKKLLITTDCFPPRWDGVARFLWDILPLLAEKFEVTVVAPDFSGRLPVLKNVRIVRLQVVPIRFGDIFFSFPRYFFIRRLVSEADIVFNQTIGPIGMCAVLAAYGLKKKLVSYVHSVEWELVGKSISFLKSFCAVGVRLLARFLYNRCSLLLVPSEDVGKLISNAGVDTMQKVVHMGVDASYFMPGNKNAARKKNGIPIGVHVLGFCGRIAREKDIPTLCAAFKKVRLIFPDTLLLLVGAGLSLPECTGEGIILTGFVDDVRPYLQAMDVFVLPSLTETSSLATMNAMACGLPVVVTRVGSIPEYVIDGKNGMFFEKGAVNELVEKILLLLKNPFLRKKLGRTARNSMMKRSWNKTVKNVISILKD